MADRAAIEDLVAAVQGHARTLMLLAPHLREQGVQKTHQQLAALLERMHAEHPVAASIRCSPASNCHWAARQPPTANRQRAEELGLFHGGVTLGVLQLMDWDEADVDSLAKELLASGLATPAPHNHLRLHPALCPVHPRPWAARRE